MNRPFSSPTYLTTGVGSPLSSLFAEVDACETSEANGTYSEDSRLLLDAAQTLVNLQQTSGIWLKLYIN